MEPQNLNLVAVYRVLYGEDFIQESILSILPFVDKVFVVKAERPWGSSSGVVYKDEWISWPKKFDNTREKVLELQSPKVEIIDDWWPTPQNQLTHIVNDLVLPRVCPETVLFIEPDHVLSETNATNLFAEWKQVKSNLSQATCPQVELWRTPLFHIPNRPNRTSIVFHHIQGAPMRPTGFNGAAESISKLSSGCVHNFGFCLSPEIMRWKHLTAMAFSREIGDSVPNPDWYEKVWLGWDYHSNNRNLEISLGYEHLIPHALLYNVLSLPTSIIQKYNI